MKVTTFLYPKPTSHQGARRGAISLVTLLAAICFAVYFPSKAHAITSSDSNPYTAIVERNPFGLKPPPNPADIIKPPPVVVADLKLQGITTILGRKQVLLKVKMPAKPPEPARDESLVLSEGQREGEVEVLEINPVDGSVKLRNNGSMVSLNMKDDAEKPTPGAVAPTAPGIRPGGLPGVPPLPPGAAVPTAAASGSATAVESFGGSKTIPTRTLRSGVESGSTAGAQIGGSGTAQASQLNADTAAALYIVNQAKNEQLRQAGVPLPKMPQHPFLKGQ